jgi:hypothetical protein
MKLTVKNRSTRGNTCPRDTCLLLRINANYIQKRFDHTKPRAKGANNGSTLLPGQDHNEDSLVSHRSTGVIWMTRIQKTTRKRSKFIFW